MWDYARDEGDDFFSLRTIRHSGIFDAFRCVTILTWFFVRCAVIDFISLFIRSDSFSLRVNRACKSIDEYVNCAPQIASTDRDEERIPFPHRSPNVKLSLERRKCKISFGELWVKPRLIENQKVTHSSQIIVGIKSYTYRHMKTYVFSDDHQ